MKFKEFIKNIFSITDYGETHHIMRIFGLKFKFPKAEYAKKRNENPYHFYKKNNIDITTIPPAEGQIRDIQLANLVLLRELDYVCKESGLKYWLEGGTLLGAVRHKGFIPWDDDIDTAMIRDDYEKIIEAFEKYSRNPDIYASVTKDKRNNCIIKVQHKKCPLLFVDIFPWDIYGDCLTTTEQIKKTQEIKKIRKSFKKLDIPTVEFKNILNKTMKDNILLKADNEHTDFVWGIDYNHQWGNWFTKYDVVFPLKSIVFEGIEFPCLSNPDVFLTRVYGDYISYPKKITMGHSMFLNLTDKEKSIIEELLKCL